MRLVHSAAGGSSQHPALMPFVQEVVPLEWDRLSPEDQLTLDRLWSPVMAMLSPPLARCLVGLGQRCWGKVVDGLVLRCTPLSWDHALFDVLTDTNTTSTCHAERLLGAQSKVQTLIPRLDQCMVDHGVSDKRRLLHTAAMEWLLLETDRAALTARYDDLHMVLVLQYGDPDSTEWNLLKRCLARPCAAATSMVDVDDDGGPVFVSTNALEALRSPVGYVLFARQVISEATRANGPSSRLRGLLEVFGALFPDEKTSVKVAAGEKMRLTRQPRRSIFTDDTFISALCAVMGQDLEQENTLQPPPTSTPTTGPPPTSLRLTLRVQTPTRYRQLADVCSNCTCSPQSGVALLMTAIFVHFALLLPGRDAEVLWFAKAFTGDKMNLLRFPAILQILAAHVEKLPKILQLHVTSMVPQP